MRISIAGGEEVRCGSGGGGEKAVSWGEGLGRSEGPTVAA